MKVKMLRSTVANGKDLFRGKTYDLDENVARYLIQIGKATNKLNTKAPTNGQTKSGTKQTDKSGG